MLHQKYDNNNSNNKEGKISEYKTISNHRKW